jgi:asparagine synthase (glutamine-hydrolysing)
VRSRDVLDHLLADALSATPCHVSFSGGRDSSVILAAATAVARREGLPDPVPLTERFAQHKLTHEDEWQEAVVRHLRLGDWTVVQATDELEVLGDLATSLLRRHGVYQPTPAHNMAFIASHAGGGTLLTGTGGDEIFSAWGLRRPPWRQIVSGPRRRLPLRLGYHALPGRVRHAVDQRRYPPPQLPWLKPEGQRRLDEAWRAASPYLRTWRAGMRDMLDSRPYELTRGTLEAFAAEQGVRLVEPFWDPRYIDALVREGPPRGYRSRDEALEALFSDLLPQDVLRRSTKAVFNEILVGERTRAFVESWDGTGLDERLVEPAVLRDQWRERIVDLRTLSALQLAWLATQ